MNTGKKVTLLVGSAGLAGPLLGFTVPGQAVAAARPVGQSPARPALTEPTGKKVSLELTSATPSGAVTIGSGTNTAVTSSAAVSPSGTAITAASNCTGDTRVRTVSNGGFFVPTVSTEFWWRAAPNGGDATCIGAVKGTWWSWPGNPGYEFTVKVYSGTGKKKHLAYNKYVGSTQENYHTTAGVQGLHKWFGATYGLPIEVCAGWVFHGTNSGGQAISSTWTWQCRTVR